MRPTVLAVVLILAATAAPALAAPTPFLVDSCGEIVPPKAAAYLAGDLDCSGSSAMSAVELGKRATLDLGGFTLTTSHYGVRCDFGGCRIANGTITGAAYAGIVGFKTTLENLTVSTSGTFAVVLELKSTVRSSVITGNALMGIYSVSRGGRVTLVDSTVSGHGRFGIWAPKVALKNSTVTGNMNDPDCAADALCADLLTMRRPLLKNSSCGRSDDLPDEPIYPDCLGWCVCADD